MHAVDRETFEVLLDAAIAALPRHFRERIENVSFIVEDWARLRRPQPHRHDRRPHAARPLRGVPLPRRTSSYNLTTPDVIVVFQQPLQRMARDAEHLATLVERTVQHEVAHYFGISAGGCAS